ncbi:epoxide hydrolase N-terminal domain-containing protein [Nonomuraea thailandensis]
MKHSVLLLLEQNETFRSFWRSDHEQHHPFRVEIPQTDLDDLQARLALTRFADEIPGADQGVSVERVKRLVTHWRDGFDWRAVEARLNAHPQFTTEIDGQNIHFLHVRSDNPDALALILTHGWPGSIAEYLRAVEPCRATSTWSSRRCPATASRARRASWAGTTSASPGPGPS